MIIEIVMRHEVKGHVPQYKLHFRPHYSALTTSCSDIKQCHIAPKILPINSVLSEAQYKNSNICAGYSERLKASFT